MISSRDKKLLKEQFSVTMDRMIALLSKKEKVDRIPCAPEIGAASRHVIGAPYIDYSTNSKVAFKCWVEAMKLIGHDALPLTLWPDLCVESADFGGATIFPIDDTPFPDPTKWLIKEPKDYKLVKKFSWDKAKRMYLMIDLMRRYGELFDIGGAMTIGPMGVLCRLRRPQDLLRDWIMHKEEVHEAMDFITDVLIEYVEKQLDSANTRLKMCVIPTVGAQSCIMSRELWEEIDAPYLKRIVDAAKKKGSIFVSHNCGRGAYFDLLIKWLKPMAMHFAYLPHDCQTEQEMIEKYSKKVIMVGYVETTLLGLGTPSEVFEESKRQIEVFRDWKRGYVLSSACEYPVNSQLYNAIAMVKAAEKYGYYE